MRWRLKVNLGLQPGSNHEILISQTGLLGQAILWKFCEMSFLVSRGQIVKTFLICLKKGSLDGCRCTLLFKKPFIFVEGQGSIGVNRDLIIKPF